MKKVFCLVLTMIAFTLVQEHLNAGENVKFNSETSINSIENGNKHCEIIKKHPFSLPDKKDTFKLIYNCENLEDTMLFQIIGFSGRVIYEKKFSGTSFYDYGRPWYIYVTDPKRGKDFNAQKLNGHVADSLHQADLQYIKNRMNEFFNDDRFMVNPVMKLDKKYLDEFHYEGISGDSTVIGFRIHLYVEGFEMIAYSKKLQKVQFIASAD